jgi:hypothetical protein
VAADSDDPFAPRSPLGKEARSLSDQAWTRARAHELTEEQLQDIIGQLESLATREPDQFEREGIQASAANLRDLFQLVEYQEQDAELARISDSPLVRRAEEIAGQAAPVFKPDAETPQERAERRERIQKALSGVSELFWQATWEQQQVLQELVDTLRWARDAIDGNATPT